jgi:hypothetical protein
MTASKDFLISLFLHVRRGGFDLGVGELLAAVQAVDGGWGAGGEEELKQIVEWLWCKTPEEVEELNAIWASITLSTSSPVESVMTPEPPNPKAILGAADATTDAASLPSWRNMKTVSDLSGDSEWVPVPVRSPFVPLQMKGAVDLNSYWPVSRRFMSYMWRYLRRPLHDGPADVLNIGATIEKTAKQGFFLSPIYQRRTRNYAHLILLIDQGGSMTPFHRFSRNLAETAQHESNLGVVDVFYFHDVIAGSVYLDPFLTTKVRFDEVLEHCTGDSSVLIVSDAGAARGHRKLERIKATTEFLYRLKQQTSLIAWLNPMPQDRWAYSSAQIISHLISMFQMDSDGFSNAIDVVRGQTPEHQLR